MLHVCREMMAQKVKKDHQDHLYVVFHLILENKLFPFRVIQELLAYQENKVLKEIKGLQEKKDHLVHLDQRSVKFEGCLHSLILGC